MYINLQHLAEIMSGIYGHVRGDTERTKEPFQLGIMYALGSLSHEICDLLEDHDSFDREQFLEDCGYRRAKDSIGFVVSDQ